MKLSIFFVFIFFLARSISPLEDQRNIDIPYEGECYIQTGLLTMLYAKPCPVGCTVITQLPEYKKYKPLKMKKIYWVNNYIYFFYIEDKGLDVKGWVKADLLLNFVHPSCLK